MDSCGRWSRFAFGFGFGRSGEAGQSTAEYSLLTLSLLVGAVAGVAGFLPASFGAYEAYVHGFWLVLGLPFP